MGPVVPCETWRDTGDGLTGGLWAWPQRSQLLVAGQPPSPLGNNPKDTGETPHFMRRRHRPGGFALMPNRGVV
jgi:hypothetical protein